MYDNEYVDLDADLEDREGLFDDDGDHDGYDPGNADQDQDEFDAFDMDTADDGASGFSPAAECAEILVDTSIGRAR